MAVNFARKESFDYTFVKKNSNSNSVVKIELTRENLGRENDLVFSHLIFFENGKIVKNQTFSVRYNDNYKKAQVDFLKYLRKSGINIGNVLGE